MSRLRDRVPVPDGRVARNQYLAAGLIDEFELQVVPVLLGDGERLFAGAGPAGASQVRSIEAPGVTHVRFDVVR